MTSCPISVARYTTLLMTAFSPGTSPPPVRTAIRWVDMSLNRSGFRPLTGLRFGRGRRRDSDTRLLASTAMNYELFMGEALAEAQLAIERGERPIAAVAVVDEAMVARAHDKVEQADDPTAHAVIVALRGRSRRLGRSRLRNATISRPSSLVPCVSGHCSKATSRR